MNKRRKEQERRQYQEQKAMRRAQRMQESSNRPEVAPGEDPDIAGIVPGPQPPRED
jgi:hypothetical protein